MDTIKAGGDGTKITKWIPFEEYGNYIRADDKSDKLWKRAYNAVLNHCKENNIVVSDYGEHPQLTADENHI